MVIRESLERIHSGFQPSEVGVGKPHILHDFEQLASNSDACRLALAFTEFAVKNVAVYGAGGWGKSHLLRAVGSRIGVPVTDLRERRAGRLPDAPIAILDDADAWSNSLKKCQEIRLHIERRIRARKRTIVVLADSERTARTFLPSPRSWKLVRLNEPCDAERRAIVRRMCTNEGLELSHTSVELVARLVRGDGHSLIGALGRLRIGADGHAASLHPLRVVGLLHPYLLDNCDYDLRDVVLDHISRSSGADARRHLELAVFTLSEVAGLPEGAVANYFGMSPGEVYRIHTSGRRRREADPIWRSQVDRIVYTTASYLCEA
jgi:hypothetical protein